MPDSNRWYDFSEGPILCCMPNVHYLHLPNRAASPSQLVAYLEHASTVGQSILRTEYPLPFPEELLHCVFNCIAERKKNLGIK